MATTEAGGGGLLRCSQNSNATWRRCQASPVASFALSVVSFPRACLLLALPTWVGAGVEQRQAPGDGGMAHGAHHSVQAGLARQANQQVAGGGSSGGHSCELRVVVVDGGHTDGVGACRNLLKHKCVGRGGVAAEDVEVCHELGESCAVSKAAGGRTGSSTAS